MSYRSDPDNSLKMIPNTKVIKDAYGHATTPVPKALSPRPSYVMLNKSGNYAFLYEESGSYPTNYISGSQVTGDDSGAPVRLDIQPKAWAAEGGATGDVTFVYRGD